MAFTGCVSLVITGELVPVFLVPGIALVPGYYRLLKGCEQAPRWAISVLSIAAVGLLAFDMTTVSGDFFIAVAHMSIAFQAIKSFDLRDPWDHLQVYFMSLLQLIMTSELAVSMAVGGMFVVFLFMLVAAIVFSHFMKEGTLGKVSLKKPVAVISILAFAGTVLFFVLVPRAQGSFWSRKTSGGIKTVGFSGEVDFGSFGDALKDPSIVMRVSLSGPELPLYWRGSTLDHFDGTAWKDTLKRRRRIYKRGKRFDIPGRGGRKPVTVQRIFLEPIDTDVVFGLGEITALESGGWQLFRDTAGALSLPAKTERRFAYTAYSVPYGDIGVRRRYVEHYLQLPEGTGRISRLAGDIAGAAGSDYEAALLIESYLRANYSYSLDTSPPPAGTAPIEHFLFNSKEGYCEHFATSMALMLRSLGVPSRIATGFAGGERNAMGDYVIVRQRDAHSWVEAGIGGRWMRFDPTPPEPAGAASAVGLFFDSLRMNWYRYVVGFDFADQKYLVRAVTAPVVRMPALGGLELNIRPLYLIALLFVAVPVAGRLFIMGFRCRRPFEAKMYLKLRKAVKKRGGSVKASSTPDEVAREALRLGMDAEGVSALVRLYEDARFGGRKPGPSARKRLKELASGVCSGK